LPTQKAAKLWWKMAKVEMAPPLPPNSAPSTKPARRPSRAMRNEAGMVVLAVITVMSENGKVASSRSGASMTPTSPLSATWIDEAER
jgi:hypothetical protein